MNHIRVGFSIHRPEMVPVTARIMEQHDVIFLEEPLEAGFEDMLNSCLGVEDCLMPLDLEYPEFSRRGTAESCIPLSGMPLRKRPGLPWQII
jgi:hypothetical protein